MRERLARWLAAATVVVLVALALLFAWVQRPEHVPVAGVPATEAVATGRQVYQAQGCSMCHSIAGQGNPRSPLDDVGVRRDAGALRAWIIGDDRLADELSARTRRAKADYGAMPATELDALVAYLQSLQGGAAVQ